MAIIIIGLLIALVGMILKKNRTELESIGKASTGADSSSAFWDYFGRRLSKLMPVK